MSKKSRNKITKNFLNSFVKNVIDKPEGFIAPNETRSAQALKATKELYDLGKWEERNNPVLQQNEIITKNNPFFKLFIDNCDNEQIWAEINLQNKPFLNYITSQLSDLEKFIEHEDEEEEGDDVIDDMEQDEDEDELSQMDINEEEYEEDEESDDGDSLRKISNEADEEEDQVQNHSELDDEFFSLSEFNKTTEENENFEDFDDEIDYFADPDKFGDDDEANANDVKYIDFFDPPKKKKSPKKSSKLDNLDDDSLEESDDNFLDNKVRDLFAQDESDDDVEEPKSTFQKRQEKIKKQIELLEMENVAEKDWTLIGEASSKDRPINSLLEEDLEFDHIVKPVPVITEEITEKLEDIIKRRILDETFDDVERKRDPNFRPFLPSKLIEISDEKSKKSLAEIYEEDYVKQTTGDATNEKDESLKKEHKEIENMFKDICHKLDALSNFHYTPKPPKPEISIIADVPAISMEEVIPVNVSDAKLLAPEEVYDKKKGELKGETEMNSTDKNRARAAKKRVKKKEKALKEREKKVIEKMNPGLGNKYSKQNILDSLIGQKNVTIIDKDGTKKSAVKNKGRGIDVKSTFLKL